MIDFNKQNLKKRIVSLLGNRNSDYFITKKLDNKSYTGGITMETKSRYQVLAELENKKREYMISKSNLDDGIKIKTRQIKEFKRELEDLEEDLKDMKDNIQSKKDDFDALIEATDESIKRFQEQLKS